MEVRAVVRAHANILSEVKQNGAVKVLAFFPVPVNWESDSVATCVARGPDGALYVGELLGGFYEPGNARIWRVVPGHAPTVWATGLTTVQGCGFGKDGAFCATEFQTDGLNFAPDANPAGDVVRIDKHGHRAHLGVGKLFYPSGFARDRTAPSTSPTAAPPRRRAWARNARTAARWSASDSDRCHVAVAARAARLNHRLAAGAGGPET